MSYILMSDAYPGSEERMLSVLPIAMFGIGHALFVTLMGPSIRYSIYFVIYFI